MNRLLLATAIVCATAVGYVGRVDTIGGTYYDWQMCGPQWRTVALSQGFGLNVIWMRSLDSNSIGADRNMGYNYYDFATRRWNWLGANYMQAGWNVFSARAGFGSLDVDPANRAAVVSSHQGSIRPVVARDLAPGSGVFEYCDGAPMLDGYQRPALALTGTGTIHLAVLDNDVQDLLWYSRGSSWCTWSSVGQIAVEPPVYDVHSIAASKVSDRVFVGWVFCSEFSEPWRGLFRVSDDDGVTWSAERTLLPPDVFGGDTTEEYHFTGLFGWFDGADRLHIVAAVLPIVRDTSRLAPAAICHWCESGSPQWSVVAKVEAESLAGSIGFNAAIACRPSLGCDARGNTYVAWEQADPLNVEPTTGCLRFGVWCAASADTGRTWTEPVLLTDANTTSHRFPCVSDVQLPGFSRDTVAVSYMMDLQSGFVVQSQGVATRNPVVCQFVPAERLGVEVGEPVQVAGAARGPTIVRGVLMGLRPTAYGSRQVLLNAAGRRVMDLKAGDNDVSRLAPGVYFVRKCSSGQAVKWSSEKVIVTQ